MARENKSLDIMQSGVSLRCCWTEPHLEMLAGIAGWERGAGGRLLRTHGVQGVAEQQEAVYKFRQRQNGEPR